MSLRTRVLPSIMNGVSRQPPLLRASDQNEDELNTWGIISQGLAKRPPSFHIASLGLTLSPSAFVHYINRDIDERYVVVIDAGTLRVFDTAGVEKTVNAPGGLGYLSTGQYRAVTMADYTFIVNTSKEITLDTAGADVTVDPEYFRWINRDSAAAFNYSTGYPTGGLFQYAPNPSAAGALTGEVASIEKLPEAPANGVLYKVSGTVETGFSAYYVVRNGSVWDETVAPGLKNSINATTMPHALVREADGTFTFAPFSWAPRRVGDTETNPAPTFVGRTINDVFLYQNRLGFLVDENIVFSCAGDFGNLWRNTVLDYIDSDVVDAAVSTNSVSILRHIVAFNNGLMAFADQTQFSIDNGESGLTPASLAISPVTHYEINLKCRPGNIGQEVYFCGNVNGGTAVWEYTLAMQGDNLNAAEITAHVPGYVPADITQLITHPQARALFAFTGTTDVYVYQLYWSGNEKVVSAWRKWTFKYPVRCGAAIGNSLWFIEDRPTGSCLRQMALDEKWLPNKQPKIVYLDSRKYLEGTYDAVGDHTTFTIPYTPLQASYRMVRTTDHPTRPSSLIDPTSHVWLSATQVRVPGNEPSVTAGEVYTMRWTMSQQYPQDYQGRNLQTGRLQLRTITLAYSDTAYFKTEVAPYGAALAADVEEVVTSKLAEFTGRIVGAATLVLNTPAYHTGSYSFQVYGDAAQAVISISNDTPYGSTFVSGEWEGFYVNRAI